MAQTEVEVLPLTEETLSEDALGTIVTQLAVISYLVFNTPPWSDGLAIPRLIYGLGKDLMRKNAVAYFARLKSGLVVGYNLGYEIFLTSDDTRDRTLQEVSGTNALDYLFEEGRKRIFLGDTLCVHPGLWRQGIGEKLVSAVTEQAQRMEFDIRLGRTDVTHMPQRQHFGKHGFPEVFRQN